MPGLCGLGFDYQEDSGEAPAALSHRVGPGGGV